MADIKRITPSEVVEAYAKTGMSVARNGYVSIDGTCGCGMGVYAFAFLGVSPARSFLNELVGNALDDAGFDEEYQIGFFDGFDGDGPDDAYEDVSAYGIGHQDGQAAYDAALKEAARA